MQISRFIGLITILGGLPMISGYPVTRDIVAGEPEETTGFSGILTQRDKVEVVIDGKDIADAAKYAVHKTPEVASKFKKKLKQSIIDRLGDNSIQEAAEKNAMVQNELANIIGNGQLLINNEIQYKKEAIEAKRVNSPSYIKSQINQYGMKENPDHDDHTYHEDSFDT